MGKAVNFKGLKEKRRGLKVASWRNVVEGVLNGTSCKLRSIRVRINEGGLNMLAKCDSNTNIMCQTVSRLFKSPPPPPPQMKLFLAIKNNYLRRDTPPLPRIKKFSVF